MIYTPQAWTLTKSRFTKNFGHFKGAWKKPGFYLHMIFMILKCMSLVVKVSL